MKRNTGPGWHATPNVPKRIEGAPKIAALSMSGSSFMVAMNALLLKG